MRRADQKKTQDRVIVTVSSYSGIKYIRGQGRGWTLHDTESGPVISLVDAALDLTPDRLWAIVQHGVPLADTPENRAYLWERFISRAFAEPTP